MPATSLVPGSRWWRTAAWSAEAQIAEALGAEALDAEALDAEARQSSPKHAEVAEGRRHTPDAARRVSPPSTLVA